MKYSISRDQETRIETDKDGRAITIEWGKYDLSLEVTVDEYLDKVFESIDFSKRSRHCKRACYHAFGCLDTETSKVWYLPQDTDLEHPYTTMPVVKGVDEKDLIRFDFIYFWQIDLNGIIGCGRSVIELAGLLEKFSNRLKKRMEENEDEYGYLDKKTNIKKPYSFKIYGFNLPYDFQFIKNFVESEIEIGENHHEIQVNVYENLQLLDAQMLVGNMSLKGALETVNVNIPKDGLDHSKFRHYQSKLNKRELGYCLDDVYYLRVFIEKKIDFEPLYNNVYDLPITKTKEVEYYMDNFREKPIVYSDRIDDLFKDAKIKFKKGVNVDKNNPIYQNVWLNLPDNSIVKYVKNNRTKKIEKKVLTYKSLENILMRKRVGKLYNNPEEYENEYNMLREAFAGGFTHANAKHLGKLIKNVICYDLCSAYPSEMMVQDFVYAYDEIVDKSCYNDDTKTFKDNEKYGYLMHVKFYDLKAKRPFGVISKFKDVNYGYSPDKKENEDFLQTLLFDVLYSDNGRVTNSDSFEMYLLDIDLKSYAKFYDWSSVEIIDIRRGRKYKLLPSVIDSIVKFYTDKCQYKILEKSVDYGTPEYYKYHAFLTLSKQKLNSIYGLSVKDKRKFALIKLKEIADVNERKELERDLLDKFYENSAKYETNLTYAIGVQITAYTRKRLFDVISLIPDNYFLYSDTDSIYVVNNNYCKNIVTEYSKKMQKQFNKAVSAYDFPIDKWVNTKNEPEYPCRFDEDGTCDTFITTGAKRYAKLTLDGDNIKSVKMTVAGLSKKVGETYVMEHFKTAEQFRQWFTGRNFTISKEISKKKCHTYRDFEGNIEINVNGHEVVVGSFVSLYDIPFTGSYTDTVIELIHKAIKFCKEAAFELGII